MDVTVKITVLFEDLFWIAVYERSQNGRFDVAKVIFGAEPKDYEVYSYFLDNWNALRFSEPIVLDTKTERKINPKRMQRVISKQLSQKCIETKAQQALKFQQEQETLQRKSLSKKRTEQKKQQKSKIRHNKKIEKHKGR